MLPKQALSIGINTHTPSRLNLKPCVNDATDMTRQLRSVGFQAHCVTEVKLKTANMAIRQFLSSIQPNAIVVFYFSGHGAEANGRNYLIPSDALGISAGNASSTAIDAQSLIYKMHKRRPRLVICILDCCRTELPDEPIDGRNGYRTTLAGLKAGLVPMTGPSSTIIVYACAAGEAASAASGNDRNSFYTYHLLQYLTMPNVDVETMLKYAAAATENDRSGVGDPQVPFRYSNCNELISLAGGYVMKGFKTLQRPPMHPMMRKSLSPTEMQRASQHVLFIHLEPHRRMHHKAPSFYRPLPPPVFNVLHYMHGHVGMPVDRHYLDRKKLAYPTRNPFAPHFPPARHLPHYRY